MSHDPQDNQDPKPNNPSPEKTKVQQAAELADKATGTLDNAQNAFSAIKWAGIGLVCVTVLAIGWTGYKVLYKPVAAVSDAAGNVVEAVGDGAGKAMDAVGDGAGAIKDGASGVINRLVIQPSAKNRLNTVADNAFEVLSSMNKTKAEGMKDRAFRKTSFAGSQGKICKLTLDFGNGDLSAYAAADNKAHATAKSLGSQDDRLMRLVIKTPDDDIEMNTAWDGDSKNWVMKWKKTVVKKPVSDEIAADRIHDILFAVPDQCGK